MPGLCGGWRQRSVCWRGSRGERLRGASPAPTARDPFGNVGYAQPGRRPWSPAAAGEIPCETTFKWPPPGIKTALVRPGGFPLYRRFSRSDKHGGQNETTLHLPAGAFFFPFAGSFLQNSPFTGTVSGRFLNGQAFGFGLVPFPPFPAIFKTSLRPPRRRGPSFCVDRKKAKSDQGCALDPDGQRRRSLKKRTLLRRPVRLGWGAT